MACNLTRGFALNCRDIMGGIVRAWATNFGGLGTLTIDATDQCTDSSGTAVWFQYDLKNSGNNLTVTANTARDTGTTVFTAVLSLVLPKLTKEHNVEFKLLAFGRPHWIVEDRNGLFHLLGRTHGCDMTAGTIATGGAFSDASQYTLEFTAEEKEPPLTISGATSANPTAGWSSHTETITVGTNS